MSYVPGQERFCKRWKLGCCLVGTGLGEHLSYSSSVRVDAHSACSQEPNPSSLSKSPAPEFSPFDSCVCYPRAIQGFTTCPDLLTWGPVKRRKATFPRMGCNQMNVLSQTYLQDSCSLLPVVCLLTGRHQHHDGFTFPQTHFVPS